MRKHLAYSTSRRLSGLAPAYAGAGGFLAALQRPFGII